MEPMIRSMGLSANVRVLGFTPIEDFVGYLGACDIVLNLRYPTVGESSGTLLRSLGLGKAVLVSERRIVSGVSRRCLPEGAGGRGRRGPDLRVPEPAGIAAGSGAGPGRARAGLRGRRVQLGARWRGSTPAFSKRSGGRPGVGVRERRRAAQRRRPQRRSRRSRPAIICDGWAVNEESRGYLETHQTRLVKTLEITPPGRTRAIASWRWARTCRSRPRCTPGWDTARCAAAITASWAAMDHRTVTSREGEDVRLRDRPFRRREGPLPLPRRAFLHGAVLRADRAPVRGSHAPDGRGEPHSEAGRPPGADHAEHGRAARHLGDPAGLPSGLLSRLHPAGRIGRSGCAPQSRIHAARDSPAAGELAASKWRAGDRRVSRRAASRVRLGAAPAGALPPGDGPARRRHLRAWAARPGRCASDTPGGCTHERGVPRSASHAGCGHARGTARSSTIRNESAETWRAGRRLRHRLSPVRCRNRHADRGWPARRPGAAMCSPANRRPCVWISSCRRKDGRYQVLLSPMREDVCWYYEQGWPFLLVDAATRGGHAALRPRARDHRGRPAARAGIARRGPRVGVPGAAPSGAIAA